MLLQAVQLTGDTDLRGSQGPNDTRTSVNRTKLTERETYVNSVDYRNGVHPRLRVLEFLLT